MGKRNNYDLSNPQNSTSINGDIVNGRNEKKAVPEKCGHEDGAPQRSFIYRHAFLISLMMDTMMMSLERSTDSMFRYQYFRNQYKDQLKQYNITKNGQCSSDELSPEVKAIEDNISRDNIRMSLYMDYVTILPLFIASLIIGMKSDQIGRRFLFVLSLAGGMVRTVVLALIIKLELSYSWFLIAIFASSCTGGSIGMFFASYAIISDTHGKKKPLDSDEVAASTAVCSENDADEKNEKVKVEKKEKEKRKEEQEKGQEKSEKADDDELDMSRENTRTMKIVGLEVFRRLVSSLISLANGYIIKYAGYFNCLLIVIGLRIVFLIFSYRFVSETGQQKKNVSFFAPLRTIVRALKDPLRRTTLILCNLGLFFMVFGFSEEYEVMRTYQMSPPFCFNPVQLGWLSSESRVRGVFSAALLWIWRKLHFSEPTIAGIGVLANTIGAIMLATLPYVWVFFTIPVIQIPGGLTGAMSRAITSRYVGRSALATTFALMIAGEEMFMFTGSISSNYLYQRFVSTVPTAPFYLGTASFFMSTVFYFALAAKWRYSPETTITDAEKADAR